MNAVGRFFKFDRCGTTFSREVIAGLTKKDQGSFLNYDGHRFDGW